MLGGIGLAFLIGYNNKEETKIPTKCNTYSSENLSKENDDRFFYDNFLYPPSNLPPYIVNSTNSPNPPFYLYKKCIDYKKKEK